MCMHTSQRDTLYMHANVVFLYTKENEKKVMMLRGSKISFFSLYVYLDLKMLFILLLLITQITIDSTTATASCRGAIGKSCQRNSTCQNRVKNTLCLNGKCACQAGYIQQDKYHCIPNETTTSTSSIVYDSVLGGPCESDTNCQGLIVNAVCLNNICSCETDFIPVGLDLCIQWETPTPTPTTPTTVIYDSVIGGSCESDTNCQGLVSNAICLDNICACQTGYIPDGLFTCIPGESTSSSTTTTDLIYDSVIGGSCEADTNCQGLVSNAICLNNICACQTGYIPDGLFTCIPGESTSSSTTTTDLIYDSVIGGSCEADTNCQGLVNNAICLNGICTCDTGYEPNGAFECVSIEGIQLLLFIH